MKKDEGLVQYVLAIMIVFIAALLIVYQMSIRKITIQKHEIEDGLTSSALASAIIDLNEYGTYKYIRSNNGRGTGVLAGSNNVWGSAEDNLFNIFKKNLATNLNLDEETLEPNEDSIISSKVVIKNFWIYNHELVDSVDDEGKPKMIKDYLERWIVSHEETDNFIIYQYTATPTGGFNKTQTVAVKEADGKVYTPYDTNVIEGDDKSLDGAGAGHVPVESMTIYATIEFYVNPFGHNMDGNYTYTEIQEDDEENQTKVEKTIKGWGLFGNSDEISIVKPKKITKSVVVDVKSVITEDDGPHEK